jgi:hypothetical protein
VTSALALRRRPRIALSGKEIVGAAAGGLALAGLLALVTGIAVAAAERPSVLGPVSLHRGAAWLLGPLAGHWSSLTSQAASLRWYETLALLGMLACWAVAIACARRIGLAAVLVTAFAADALLSLAPPATLTDTFNYLHYGRMGPLYGLNPYTHVPIAASADPAYRLSTWHHLFSPYGPLFTLGTELLAPLGLSTAYWALRVAVGMAAAGVAILVALLARRLGRDPATAVAFVALNPLVLLFGVEGVHNDFFVLLLLLGGALLVSHRREVLGGGAWAAAVAVKLSAGLAVPILLAGAGRRGRAAAGAALGGVAALVLVQLAFGGHLPNDAAQARLVTGLSPANQLGLALGRGGLDAVLRGELQIVLVLGTAGLCAWTWRTRDWSTAAAWAAALLILSLGWVMPWYVLWVLPFAALSSRRAPKAAAVVLTVGLLAMWAPARTAMMHHLGWHPPHTRVAHANSLYIHRLLR